MMTLEEVNNAKLLGSLAIAGLVAGLGTLLASEEPITTRVVVGRALSSMALGVTAAAAMVWIPGLSYTAQVGIACAVASLGTSGLERLYQKVMNR